MRPAIGPSCTEFVYPECWHFEKGEIDNVFAEHVLPLTILILVSAPGPLAL